MGRKCLSIDIGFHGNLEVLEQVLDVSNKKNSIWKCKCKCGLIINLTGASIKKGQQSCWDCRNNVISSKNWKGSGEISGEFWGKVLKCAKIRNLEVSITIEEAWELFIKQNRKCALSDVDLVFYRSKKDRGLTTASLDRIDSNKNYTLDNVQWVHKSIQQMKWDFNQQYYIDMCSKVARKHAERI